MDMKPIKLIEHDILSITLYIMKYYLSHTIIYSKRDIFVLKFKLQKSNVIRISKKGNI